MNKSTSLLFFIWLLVMSSCVTHKKMLYLKPEKGNSTVIETFKRDSIPPYRVRPGDVLSIEISSTVASQMEIFNKKFEEENRSSGKSNFEGYLVDKSGNIDLPLAGQIQVENLTLPEVTEAVKKKLSEYIDFIYVKTRLLNFNITLLGEVERPGTFEITSENINIFQAIGMAGDVTDVANKKNVKIIRHFKEGTKVIYVDISNKEIISSDYYYLMPNDIIYVEPLKAKVAMTNARTIAWIFSAATIFLLVLRTTR